MPGSHHILCLNSGSSSLKFAVYALGGGEERRRLEGAVERIGLDGARLWLRDERGVRLEDGPGDFGDHRAALAALPAALERGGSPVLDAVGHRVVHGGPDHTAPARVDAALVAELRALSRFAPLHLPSAIEAIEAVFQRYPALPQVACFDTAFPRRMPEVAQRYLSGKLPDVRLNLWVSVRNLRISMCLIQSGLPIVFWARAMLSVLLKKRRK